MKERFVLVALDNLTNKKLHKHQMSKENARALGCKKQTLQSQMFMQLFRVWGSAMCLFYAVLLRKRKTGKGLVVAPWCAVQFPERFHGFFLDKMAGERVL